MFELLGLRRHGSDGEKVAILVGPNGAGKSNFLRGIAKDLRHSRNIAVVCNTAYDRFAGMRGIKRVSASRAGRSPKTIVKLAVAQTLTAEDSRYYQIGKILNYCGYSDRIGFKVEGSGRRRYFDAQELLEAGCDRQDVDLAAAFFERYRGGEILWVGSRDSLLGFSQGREFASILRLESALRRQGLLRDIQVYLDRESSRFIELLHASSGELALISSLLFLIANREEEPIILVDEPENSLHPSWQREYVDSIMNALEYRSATIVIATHAPLVVTGALTRFSDAVSVFRVNRGDVKELKLSGPTEPNESIEEILWRAFEVVTPASHFVSEELAGVVAQVESGEMERKSALARVAELGDHSFDERQQQFLGAVRELIEKVDDQRQSLATDA